jgi:hypothetical protein
MTRASRHRFHGDPERFRAVAFDPTDAPSYDLLVALHPDQATRAGAGAGAARFRPAVLIPCCNFWAPERLGQEALLRATEADYDRHGVFHERVRFGFAGPKHVGLVSRPPGGAGEGGAGA